MIFVSDKFKAKYPYIVKKIESSVNRPFMNDDFLHALSDILGIKTKDSDATRSIFNENFNSKRKRMVLRVDYDKELKVESTK